MELSFKPIDINAHLNIAVAFREDAHVISYGNASAFHGENGKGVLEYQSFLRSRIQTFPAGHVHIWQGDEIIGQIECKPREKQPHIGYVNLFYLRSDRRSMGLGQPLHDFVVNLLAKEHCRRLQLRVMKNNIQAVRFYHRQGWIEEKVERRGHLIEALMTKELL